MARAIMPIREWEEFPGWCIEAYYLPKGGIGYAVKCDNGKIRRGSSIKLLEDRKC